MLHPCSSVWWGMRFLAQKHFYVLAAWWLVCSCTVSARSPSGFSKETEQICLIHGHVQTCLFIITFLAMLLLIQQNDQQEIKGFSFQLHERAEK